ncbi:hypothetical protein SETIT_9G213800v2 [Setaria italica]|uniref:Uncharacterized protein n=3 Tax=Setaria TaxID=4554 RepID=A0A368SJ79_SETIT|nr:uncharacterized protein LOC101763502 [Setaria italica]XP_034574746.1 uncharacterized protein LOC117838721 [Setaria viridis]RCV42404.1 hypothetical protein SETIT_9G213800v2 [Setaria italica]TKV93229.1 hypothetical protein SEVIR_9G212700v2 [Setaria viridis]
MAAAGWTWMAEVAGEELAKLEAAHPGRFAPLKAELERLVADPGLDAAAFPLVSPAPHAVATTTDDADNTPPSSQAAPSPADAVCTQESSTRKRKPPASMREREAGKRRRRTGTPPGPGGAKDRAEMAIERAERCLERIRAIKRGLLAAWIH